MSESAKIKVTESKKKNKPENFYTEFPNQPIQLISGKFECFDDDGIFLNDELVCGTPVLPVCIYENIETSELSVRLAYNYNRRGWREVVVPFNAFNSTKKLSEELTKYLGIISCTNKLLKYFDCVFNLNKNVIPTVKSANHLGYIENHGFLPFSDDVVLGEEAKDYKDIFDSIAECGSYETWLSEARECRNNCIEARIVLDASFASVVIEKLGCQPFITHVWGVDSGTGKTVSLMLAVSVWGSPRPRSYMQTFKSTEFYLQCVAGFLNNLPLIIDEAQLARDDKGKVKVDIYQFAEGESKGLGNKERKIDKRFKWQNCTITSGETPLNSDNSGAGAINRILEVKCSAKKKIIENGAKTAEILRKNHGFAGKKFLALIDNEDVFNELKSRFENCEEELKKYNSTDKQIKSFAVILAVDYIVSKYIFGFENEHKEDAVSVGYLTCKAVSRFMQKSEKVSTWQRGYNALCGWVSSNDGAFTRGCDNPFGIYGEKENKGYVWINFSKFKKALLDEGFNYEAVLSGLESEGLIKTFNGEYMKYHRIGNGSTYCVLMKMPNSF